MIEPGKPHPKADSILATWNGVLRPMASNWCTGATKEERAQWDIDEELYINGMLLHLNEDLSWADLLEICSFDPDESSSFHVLVISHAFSKDSQTMHWVPADHRYWSLNRSERVLAVTQWACETYINKLGGHSE